MKRIVTTIAVLIASVPAPAIAAVTVLGGGFARGCYQAAELKRSTKTGISDCEMALKEEVLSQNDRAATYVNRGIIYMYERNFQQAIADYDNALKIDGKLAEAYVNKGIAVLHQGSNHSHAVDLLSQGLALEPDRPEVAYYSRAVAHEMVGNTKQAFYDYKQAASLKPDWADPQRELQRFKVLDK